MSDFLLKTVKADGTARGGFQWPLDEGAEVTAPGWDPTPVCGIDGIVADTPYRVVDGALVEVES